MNDEKKRSRDPHGANRPTLPVVVAAAGGVPEPATQPTPTGNPRASRVDRRADPAVRVGDNPEKNGDPGSLRGQAPPEKISREKAAREVSAPPRGGEAAPIDRTIEEDAPVAPGIDRKGPAIGRKQPAGPEINNRAAANAPAPSVLAPSAPAAHRPIKPVGGPGGTAGDQRAARGPARSKASGPGVAESSNRNRSPDRSPKNSKRPRQSTNPQCPITRP